ncbi:MAG: cellobiose phosphorylase [Lachnospiraceae bacterium]|nr:cellobiose phosphorylase [Lachnospiraceae bacterium]
MEPIKFIDEHGSFTLMQPENTSYLYFPLASETGLKSAVTPNLGGDAKLDQESFLLEPVSSENLHNNRSTRNFWCVIDDAGVYSAMGASASQEADKFTSRQDDSQLTAGFMWQTLTRTSEPLGIKTTVTSFIPRNDNVELMHITVQNISEEPKMLTAYGAVPVYGRSADNMRDHRNVTSMLHRIRTTKEGVIVTPTMSFDEKGHRPNHKTYYVAGFTGEGGVPEAFYPTVEDYIGEGGSYTHPRCVYEQTAGLPADSRAQGKEAMGAFRFGKTTLSPNGTIDYIILLGVAEDNAAIEKLLEKYNTLQKVQDALTETRSYWQKKVCVDYHTKNETFDRFMKWVSFQPYLRRLFGCSFLPHHDYGRGGRGWRDLWQDCLSLLLMEPLGVGRMIEANYGGVRIDGTNATIIGDGNGNFIADRNGIARVWMDHALWPLMTTRLYIDQTGDIDILYREAPYFKDAQTMRGTCMDTLWSSDSGSRQLTERNEIYTGSILEHLLVQQLTAFYEVGDHNIYRLRGADWNDALDMAAEHGESVAFTCAYAGNLRDLASLLLLLDSVSAGHTVELLEEISVLLTDDPKVYDDINEKHRILNDYSTCCRHFVTGSRKAFRLSDLAEDLTRKADWLTTHIRSQEWIAGNGGEGWFNSYYDNHGNAVEGFFGDQVRMMLTGQVFAIMGGVAEDEHIAKIVKAADRYLYRKEIGGYRLNTDFEELKFDMGRMFGFAYGEKENGAVFSHMTVMYANALYRRGFVKEGWKALETLADTALDFHTSHIYPGIPEYFRADGRGMYHYLTGAASWFMMTMITEVFGVRGKGGALMLSPKLLAAQFDEAGTASITVPFAGKTFTVVYQNESGKEFGSYHMDSALCGGTSLPVEDNTFAILSRELLESLSESAHRITVKLV